MTVEYNQAYAEYQHALRDYEDALEKLEDVQAKIFELANGKKPKISPEDAEHLAAVVDSAMHCVEGLF